MVSIPSPEQRHIAGTFILGSSEWCKDLRQVSVTTGITRTKSRGLFGSGAYLCWGILSGKSGVIPPKGIVKNIFLGSVQFSIAIILFLPNSCVVTILNSLSILLLGRYIKLNSILSGASSVSSMSINS